MAKFVAYQNVNILERHELEIDESLVKKINALLGLEDLVTLEAVLCIANDEVEQAKYLLGIKVTDEYGDRIEAICWISQYLKKATLETSPARIVEIERGKNGRMYSVEE